MCVTPSGIFMDVREEQEPKTPSPMFVTLEGIIVFRHTAINVLVLVSIIALHPSRESYAGLSADTVMEVRERQSQKTLSPKLVTLEGMSTEVREWQ